MKICVLYCVALLGITLAWQLGCSKPQPISSDPPPIIDGHEGHDHSHEGHAHDHGHSHADLGPNGGHLIELGKEQYHIEWTHDDNSGRLTMFVLDANAKELVPIAAEKITIEKTLGTRTDKYELTAVDRKGDMPKSAKFEIEDKGLIEGLKLAGNGVEASLSVDVNGEPFTAKFTKHHDHKH